MFLRYIKDFGLKKIIKKRLANHQQPAGEGVVVKVGVIVDETYFANTPDFISALEKQGIRKDNIRVLAYKAKPQPQPDSSYTQFGYKDIGAGGTFSAPEVAGFLSEPFDLLINYYDVGKLPLLAASLQSAAKFTTGLGTVDERMNHLIIRSAPGNYKEFINELFKYLKTLNKL